MAKRHKTHLISKKKFRVFLETHHAHRLAKPTFDLWVKVVVNSRWDCFADVRETFGSASPVGPFVVFNVAGNKYRIVTEIAYHLKPKRVYIRHVLTHQEYDEESWKH